MDTSDLIKDAFTRAKQDILSLQEQFSLVLYDIDEIKRTLYELKQQIHNQTSFQTSIQTEHPEITAELQQLPFFPTDGYAYKPLKPHVYHISTGNGGVPTNQQTNQQTDQHPFISIGNNENNLKNDKINQIERVSELLESLGTIKKDLRVKFKHLTKQEMIVFSTLYQLEEEGFIVDYPIIAKKLALSESSIRDYIQRIIRKGIPIQKSKENNKKITLFLSKDFKKLASLQTILQLRSL